MPEKHADFAMPLTKHERIVGPLEERLRSAEAERDRLRAVVEAARGVAVVYDSENLDNISECLPFAVDRLVAELRAHYVAMGEDPDVWLTQ